MKVKELLSEALALLGMNEISDEIYSKNGPTGESANVVNTLLYCLYAVENEMARYYFPKILEQELEGDCGEYYFSDFKYTPLKIEEVRDFVTGEKKEYTIVNNTFLTDSYYIVVKYYAAPVRYLLNDDDIYTEDEMSATLIANGVAAEYCLINGEVALAESFESAYRREIDLTQKKNRKSLSLPPRRWV